MTKKFLLVFSLMAALAGCDEEAPPEDVVKEPSKEASVETQVATSHGEGFDLVTTTQKIWLQNNIVKTFTHTDTIPSLGRERREIEDENGNTKDTMVAKEYEIYLTAK